MLTGYYSAESYSSSYSSIQRDNSTNTVTVGLRRTMRTLVLIQGDGNQRSPQSTQNILNRCGIGRVFDLALYICSPSEYLVIVLYQPGCRGTPDASAATSVSRRDPERPLCLPLVQLVALCLEPRRWGSASLELSSLFSQSITGRLFSYERVPHTRSPGRATVLQGACSHNQRSFSGSVLGFAVVTGPCGTYLIAELEARHNKNRVRYKALPLIGILSPSIATYGTTVSTRTDDGYP